MNLLADTFTPRFWTPLQAVLVLGRQLLARDAASLCAGAPRPSQSLAAASRGQKLRENGTRHPRPGVGVWGAVVSACQMCCH